MNSSEAFCLTNWGISLYTSFVWRKSQGFSFVFPWYTRNLLIERQVYLHYENNVVTILRKGDMKKLVNGLKINFVMDYRQWWGLLVELNKEKTDWENYSMFQKWCLRRTIWTFCHNLILTCYAHKKKKQRKIASSKLLKIPGKSNRSDKRSYFQLRTLPIARESIMKECDITPCGGRSTPTSSLICSYSSHMVCIAVSAYKAFWSLKKNTFKDLNR